MENCQVNADVDDRTLVIGMAEQCPLGGNPAECQWHFLRELPVCLRLAYVDAMTPHEIGEVACRHRECLCRKRLEGMH